MSQLKSGERLPMETARVAAEGRNATKEEQDNLHWSNKKVEKGIGEQSQEKCGFDLEWGERKIWKGVEGMTEENYL